MPRKRNLDAARLSDQQAAHGRTVAGASTGYVEVRKDSKVFATNLRRLTLMAGLNWRSAAERVGATGVWYRRAVSKGLSRTNKATRPILERIVAEFHLTTVEDLWEPNLVRFERSTGAPQEPDAHLHLVWRQKEWWPWAKKLAHILASGEHDYLKDMIDKLYQTVRPGSFKEPEPGAAYWSSDSLDQD